MKFYNDPEMKIALFEDSISAATASDTGNGQSITTLGETDEYKKTYNLSYKQIKLTF